MTDLEKAARMALEALENPWKAGPDGVANAITALRQALEQPAQQEPVAVYVGETWCGSVVRLYDDLPLEAPLYTLPPAREWVGLTYEEAKEIYTCIHGYDSSKRIAEAIEAKLKEKNT